MDEALLGIFSLASHGQLMKILITLEPPGTLISNLARLFILTLYSIYNWYICKTLTKFHRASFRSVEVFSENAYNSWTTSKILIIFCIQYPTEKKRTSTIFPFRSPFNAKMIIVMKYSFLIKF